MLLVVGSTRGEATYGGAGVVAFYFPSVRLCAGGSALRTPVEHPGAVTLQVAVFKLVARPLGHHAQGVGEAAADSFSAHLRGERAAQQLAELEGGLAPQRFGVDEGAVHVPEDGLGPTQVPEAR